MCFESKTLNEITQEDLLNLIGKKESLRLEFKKEYGTNDKSKSEILKDVAALANAEGGYIIIGLEEDEDHRAKNFVSVSDPSKMVDSIRDLCSGRIETRLLTLQIRGIEVDGHPVVVVRVPNEEPKPHWVKSKGDPKVSFPRRIADGIVYLTIDDVRRAFQGDRMSRQIGRIEGRIKSLQHTPTEKQPITDESMLRSTDGEGIQKYLDDSFKKRIKNSPVFRISLFPQPVPSDMPLYQHFDEVVRLVEQPPETRTSGWSITPTGVATPEGSGWAAINNAQCEGLRIMWNGCVEFWCDTTTDPFQHAYADIQPPRPYLADPRAMIEPAVCMARLARKLSKLLPKVTHFELRADFWNCTGLKLIKYPPGSFGHRHVLSQLGDPQADASAVRTLEKDHVRVIPERFSVEDTDDSAAKALALNIYRCFGFTDAEVQYFDDQNLFSI